MDNNSSYALFGRFFMPVKKCFALLLISSPLFAQAISTDCRVDSYETSLIIRHVLDGDTVVLDNGTRLRLIGIDSPELDRENGQNEPWSVEALDYLSRLVEGEQGKVYAVYDIEHTDRYNRVLAHLFSGDGESIQARILDSGLATPLVIPPNLKFYDCYRNHALNAARSRTGIWSELRYQPRDVKTLNGSETGFHVIIGEVTRIGESRSSIWINLGNQFAVRITRDDLEYFPGFEFQGLKQRHIQVQGDVYRRNNQQRIRVRHPADLHLLE